MIFTRIKEVGAQNLQVVEELDSEETTPRTRKILETRQDDLKEEWKSLECKLDDWMGELTAGRIREEQKGRVISMLRRQSSNVSDQSDRPLNCLDE